MKKLVLASILAVTTLGAAGVASAYPPGWHGGYHWHGHWYHHRHWYWGPGHRRAWRYW